MLLFIKIYDIVTKKQTIKFLRKEVTQSNIDAAKSVLDNYPHLRGQPVVVYYGNSSTPEALMGLGTADGTGKYSLGTSNKTFNVINKYDHNNSIQIGYKGTPTDPIGFFAGYSNGNIVNMPHSTAASIVKSSASGDWNININGSAKEAFLKWGGRNIVGGYGCIDAAMIDALGANRFAFAKAEGITIEYSTDGATWLPYVTDGGDRRTLTTVGATLYVGKTLFKRPATANDKLRITFDTSLCKIYTSLNKFAIEVSTNYSDNNTVTIERAIHSEPTKFITIVSKQPIGGWPGQNIINTYPFITYGRVDNQNRLIRFTFE